ELRVRLQALRRGQLARDRGLARKLVEREEVYVRLAHCARDHQDVLTVRTYRLILHVNADGQKAQPPPYSVEYDLDRLILLLARRLNASVRGVRRRGGRRRRGSLSRRGGC